jgi:hypothetical protein
MSVTGMILLQTSELAANAQIYGAAIVVIALLLWRLWRFTLRPCFYVDDPKELPYWIPCKIPYFAEPCLY